MAEDESVTPEHANGPRTFGTTLRDAAPMSSDMLERLIAIEAGRHPTLTASREALAFDLDLGGAPGAARNLWPPRDEAPDDARLAAIIDAMYSSIESSRLISVAITDAGPQPSRNRDTIVLRDEEHLVFLVLAENATDAGVRFSAEAHGEGIGGYVEAHRSGSTLFDAGAMHPGSYLLPLLVVAEGTPATLDVPIECRPSGILRLRIIDDATGERVAARVYVTDAVGETHPAGVHARRDVHGGVFFHADGSCEVRVSGSATVRVVRGIEYETFEQMIAVPADREIETEVRLRRWSHMAADGWYCGDVHVHLHYGGEYLLGPADASLAQRGEDLNFMNMMVANQGSGWVHDADLFTGRAHELSDGGHLLQWGEEYRNDFLGHMCMYGIGELVPPIYSGFPLSEHPDDLPANAIAAAHAHTVGGTLGYAHPMFGDVDLDRIFSRKRTVEAKELPVDAALGHIDAIDVLSYPSRTLPTCQLWYRLLNCGLRLAATAGTDTFMNSADQDEFSNPPGGCRAYVGLGVEDGAFTTESWCAGVRAGRTIVTNGPMISLSVNDAAIGDTIDAHDGDTLRIEAEAGSQAPIERIEIVVNGEIVASTPADADGRHATITHEIAASESGWIAARVIGPKHALVLDPDGAFAHTSPIYVTIDGAPIAASEDAAFFVEWIDRLIEMYARVGHVPSDAERDAVIAIFREGQAYYRRIIEQQAST